MAKKRVIIKFRVDKGKTPDDWLTLIKKPRVAPGFRAYSKFKPFRVPPTKKQLSTFRIKRTEETFIALGKVDKAQYTALKKSPNTVGLWDDPKIHYHTYDAGGGSRGTIHEIINYINAKWIWAKGYRGKDIVIGVVDSGVHHHGLGESMLKKDDGTIDGWPPPEIPGSRPGTITQKCHATTMAFDAINVCPEAKILDIGIDRAVLEPGDNTTTLGMIINAYQWILDRFNMDAGPHVLLNSWGVHPEEGMDYATNHNNEFTTKVEEAIAAGILVCFSAGNCGTFGPDGTCKGDSGQWYSGVDNSIWGANGHPDVITVGASNNRGQWMGWSSQGRAWYCNSMQVEMFKPDICAPCQFQGYNLTLDKGTSASNAIIAGVLGLLKSVKRDLMQKDIGRIKGAQTVLRESANTQVIPAPPTVPGGISPPDYSWGCGLVDVKAAYQLLTGDMAYPTDPQGNPIDYLNLLGWIPEGTWVDPAEPQECRCFIATAAFGSYLDPHVQFLREFRDEVVLTSTFASSFQRLLEVYYQISPPVARKMNENMALRTTIRLSVVMPLISLLKAIVSLKYGPKKLRALKKD